jgi:hypothetical protein
MLIALIISLIFGVAGEESEFATSIPHIKKEIRQNVQEAERKDTLIVLVKDYEKAIKQYDKEKKKLRKEVNKAGTDREVSTEDLLGYYDAYYNARISLLSELIGYRLMFQEKVTDEELLLITNNAILTTTKEYRKEGKEEDKQEKALEKVFLNLNKIIVKHITDSTKLTVIKGSLQEFENTVYTFVDEARNLALERKARVDDRDASREEIEEIYEPINQLRYKASREFAKLREVVIENTDNRQWKAINRELKVFLKS